ncbi:hypothetical protein CN692_14245 [Bacillus sp. AFS002410]|uniref:DUF5659 domain-containing protein n=1 Tax=Bacillus sp. AFS002410 TaxID=2033481 RepID=UPI000BEF62FA|nr:DUF5659 domain-containing protein [Bacillus sp. AFS002410]PEJ57055.1 hypothetical protein CN692_14245 [Bacillus sp. AFS002410]
METYTKKRIFSLKVTNFLLSRGAELIEIRSGEVMNDPRACTFLFARNEKLSEALTALEEHNKMKKLMPN